MTETARQLDRYRTAEFSLEELAAAAGRLLRRMAVRPSDGRVAGAPDERSIRFYQTAGVVDRPLRYEGRRAVYGFRHLLQLLAVKRLQQEGQPLALIQRGLAGRQTADLERALATAGEADASPHTRPERASPQAEPGAAYAAGPALADPSAARSLIAIEIAEGITLTIDPARVPDPGSAVAKITELFRK